MSDLRDWSSDFSQDFGPAFPTGSGGGGGSGHIDMFPYYFPVDNTQAKSVAAALFSTGVLVALWPNNETWYFNGSGLVTSSVVPGASNSGFSSVVTDFSSGVWLSQYTGYLAHAVPGSALTSYTLYTLPSGEITSGGAFVAPYSSFYTIGSGGQVYLAIGGITSTVGPALGTGSWGLATSGTTLFSLQASLMRIGQLSLPTSSSGVSGFLALPSGLNPTCILASTAASSIAVGGWAYSSISSNFSQIFCNPVAPYVAMLTPALNYVSIYAQSIWGVWTNSAVYAGVGNPTYGSWSPDGLHFAVSDPVCGAVSVFTFAFGSGISSLQLPLSNAGPNGWVSPNNFLVCETVSGLVASVYRSGLSWNFANSILLTGLTSIAVSGAYQAIAGFASGLAFLSVSRSTNNVILTTQITLPFTPSSVASDNFGYYAVGSLGSSGYLSIFSGQSIRQTLSWIGSGNSVATLQDQILVVDSSVPILRVFGYLQGSYKQIYTTTNLPNNVSGGVVITPNTPYSSGGSIFIYGSGAAYEYQFVSPFGVVPVPTGELALYTSGAWTTTSLATGKVPSSLLYDVSGNVYVTTVQNDLYFISATGGVSGYSLVPPYQNQLGGVPLGLSSMVIYNNMAFASSSLAGFLVNLNVAAIGPPPPPIGPPLQALLSETGGALLSEQGGVLLPE